MRNRLFCLSPLTYMLLSMHAVRHDIKLNILSKIGVNDEALTLSHSYLQSRTQCVMIDGFFSDRKLASKSVPQGSVLGPRLFVCTCCISIAF